MTIELTPEIVAPLAARAQQRGLTPEELAREILRDELDALKGADSVTNGADDDAQEPEDRAAEPTLYELLVEHIGVINSSEYVPGGAHLSQDCGRKFAEGMLEKRRQGKL